jgi:hypothetical protein
METATAAKWTPTPTRTPTRTPTNTPTFTLTFTATPYPLYFDDFEDEDSGWDIYNSTTVRREYADGGYRILMKEIKKFTWSRIPNEEWYSDIRIEVDAARTDGPDENDFGVLCRYQDPFNFYGLEISSSGWAFIFLYEDGRFISLFSEEVNGINPDDWNHISAICNGDEFELYANGDLVANAWDDTFREGEIALVAGDFDISGTEILFDNLYVFPA